MRAAAANASAAVSGSARCGAAHGDRAGCEIDRVRREARAAQRRRVGGRGDEAHLGHALGLRRESHGDCAGAANRLQPCGDGRGRLDRFRKLDPAQAQGFGADDDQGSRCVNQRGLHGAFAWHVEHVADAPRGQQAAGNGAAGLKEQKSDGSAPAGDAVERRVTLDYRAAARDLEACLDPLFPDCSCGG